MVLPRKKTKGEMVQKIVRNLFNVLGPPPPNPPGVFLLFFLLEEVFSLNMYFGGPFRFLFSPGTSTKKP